MKSIKDWAWDNETETQKQRAILQDNADAAKYAREYFERIERLNKAADPLPNNVVSLCEYRKTRKITKV